MGRVIAWAGAGLLALVLFVGAGVAAVFGGLTGAAGGVAACDPTKRGPAGLTGEQTCNAATIIQVGQSMRVPARGLVVAIAAALQESNLINLPGGDRDSVGLFQQRPSQGWGTPAQLHDPVYASRRFFGKLLRIAGWERMSVADAAQAVQNSGDGSLYAKHEHRATVIVSACLAGRCGTPPPGAWVRPASGPVTSGFRTGDRPDHNGIDFGAARGSTIVAASAGVVAVVRCEVSTGTCDQAGSLSVQGCGWYVEIRHAQRVTTRYCHMLTRPSVHVGQRVATGQPIGRVGSSGNSTGPHCHFEVHTGYPATAANATDPREFLEKHGVKV